MIIKYLVKLFNNDTALDLEQPLNFYFRFMQGTVYKSLLQHVLLHRFESSGRDTIQKLI